MDAPLLPSHMWCYALPQHQSAAEASAVRRRLGGAASEFRCTTCCSVDKVDSVLHYAQVVLDFKEKTLEEQQGFAASVRASVSRSSSESPCQGPVSGALGRRADALEASLGLMRRGFSAVRRLMRGTLRAHCLLPRGLRVAVALRRSFGRGAAELAGVLRDLEGVAAELLRCDVEAEGAESLSGLGSCFPTPYTAALAGVAAPPARPRQHAHDVRYPFARPSAEVRTWLVWVDRFSLALSRFAAKVAYQLKVLTTSFEAAYREGPLGSLFWGGGALLVGPEDAWRWPNHRPARLASNATASLLLLVSNLTGGEVLRSASSEVALLLEATEGLEVLWLEDSIREPWVTAVRPKHAAWLAGEAREWWRRAGGHPELSSTARVLWRRHQTTLGNVEVAAAHLAGAPGGAAVVDLRRALAGPPGIAAAMRRLTTQGMVAPTSWPGVEVGVVRKAELDDAARQLADRSEATWAARQLAGYLDFHRSAVGAWRSGAGAAPARALVYTCNPFSLCGGHGDRTNGILSTFVLALLTNRAFFIDLDSPIGLSMLLQPRRRDGGEDFVLDWRIRGGAAGLGGQVFYLDDRVAFQEDLSWLVRDASPTLLVSMNHRELQAMFRHPLLAARARELGLQRWPHLAAQLWSVLFEPTPLLRQRLEDAAAELRLGGPLPWGPAGRGDEGFIAIHFRAGNESARLWWDPGRHSLSSLPEFLACAAQAERELGMPSSTRWFLSADTASALASEPVARLRREGKLVTLGEDWRLAHVDRSHVSLGLQGFADSYVAYYLLASARAVVLSRSYFGETAAEVGAVPSAYFAEGCVQTDLLSS